jgi:hypothetical protein
MHRCRLTVFNLHPDSLPAEIHPHPFNKAIQKFCNYISIVVTSSLLQQNLYTKIKNYQNPLMYGSEKEIQKGCA